ncbi:AraC family transcriptional regulator [Pseudohaliea sp.]
MQEGEAVSHVAEAVGYQSRTNFSRAYTRVFEIGPSETQRSGR